MRQIALIMIGLVTVGMTGYAQKSESRKKPNVILIYADDISARELPIYGSKVWSPTWGGDTDKVQYRAKTPVIDRLATEGCFIKTAWAATVCSPSRAMMMTGRYAHLHKWWMNGDYGKGPGGKTWPLYESSPHTIGHIARAGGYATYWAGKTQMKGADVTKFGFDEGVLTPGEQSARKNPYSDFQLVKAKGNEDKNMVTNQDTGEKVQSYAQNSWYWKPYVRLMNHPDSKKSLVWWPNTKKSEEKYGLNTYGPDIELEFIFDFMDRKNKEGKPFFIYHTSHLGHDGFNFLNPASKIKWPGTPKVNWDGKGYTRTEPNITGDNGTYDTHGTITNPGIHNHINYLDYQVWQYLEKLKEMGELNNTIIIFSADNGTLKFGKGNPNAQRGVHVPLVIYAPGLNMTKKGEQDILVNIADILPTLADVAGVEIPANYIVNGISLWPYLTSEKDTHREWIYSYHKKLQLIRGKYVMRDGWNKWYDVTTQPDDLVSFKKINDWDLADPQQKYDKEMLEKILPFFDLYKEAHNAPELPGPKPDKLRMKK